MKSAKSSKTSRARTLLMFGLGSASAIVVADNLVADNLFAKQFARRTNTVELPAMVYDADLQVMVDPITHRPLYARAEMLAADDKDKKDDSKKEAKDQDNKAGTNKKAKDKEKPKPLPTVTAGCEKCPKCDDDCG